MDNDFKIRIMRNIYRVEWACEGSRCPSCAGQKPDFKNDQAGHSVNCELSKILERLELESRLKRQSYCHMKELGAVDG